MNTPPVTLPIQPILPKIGSIVLITLNASLADRINKLPGNDHSYVKEGQICALMITRTCQAGCSCLMVNGRIISDTPANYRVVDVPYGKKPGQWHWPEIEHAAALTACLTTESTPPLKNASGPGISASEARLRDELITTQNNEQHFRQAFERINESHERATLKLHEQEDQIRSLKQELEATYKSLTHSQRLATEYKDRARDLDEINTQLLLQKNDLQKIIASIRELTA